MADHHCQYVVHFPDNQSDEIKRCDKPAGIKHDGRWFCAFHYDRAVSGLGYASMKYKDEK